MNLSRRGREYYKLSITTDPVTAPTAWKASFNDGSTWVTAVAVDGKAAWLVEGASAPLPVVGVVLTSSVQPLVELIDNPEVIVRSAPRIYIE